MCLKPNSHFSFFRDIYFETLNLLWFHWSPCTPFSSENNNLYENTKYSTWYLDFIFHLTFCLTSSCLAYLLHIFQFSVQTCALILIREELLSLDRMAAVHWWRPSLKSISICRQQLECSRLQQHHLANSTVATFLMDTKLVCTYVGD